MTTSQRRREACVLPDATVAARVATSVVEWEILKAALSVDESAEQLDDRRERQMAD